MNKSVLRHSPITSPLQSEAEPIHLEFLLPFPLFYLGLCLLGFEVFLVLVVSFDTFSPLPCCHLIRFHTSFVLQACGLAFPVIPVTVSLKSSPRVPCNLAALLLGDFCNQCEQCLVTGDC